MKTAHELFDGSDYSLIPNENTWIKSSETEPKEKGFYKIRGLNNQRKNIDDEIWFTGCFWCIREGCAVVEWLKIN